MFLSSCTTAGMVKTASTLKTKADIHSLTIADLEVSPERVTHTIHPSDEILRGGEENAKRAAEAESDERDVDGLHDPNPPPIPLG